MTPQPIFIGFERDQVYDRDTVVIYGDHFISDAPGRLVVTVRGRNAEVIERGETFTKIRLPALQFIGRTQRDMVINGWIVTTGYIEILGVTIESVLPLLVTSYYTVIIRGKGFNPNGDFRRLDLDNLNANVLNVTNTQIELQVLDYYGDIPEQVIDGVIYVGQQEIPLKQIFRFIPPWFDNKIRLNIEIESDVARTSDGISYLHDARSRIYRLEDQVQVAAFECSDLGCQFTYMLAIDNSVYLLGTIAKDGSRKGVRVCPNRLFNNCQDAAPLVFDDKIEALTNNYTDIYLITKDKTDDLHFWRYSPMSTQSAELAKPSFSNVEYMIRIENLIYVCSEGVLWSYNIQSFSWSNTASFNNPIRLSFKYQEGLYIIDTDNQLHRFSRRNQAFMPMGIFYPGPSSQHMFSFEKDDIVIIGSENAVYQYFEK